MVFPLLAHLRHPVVSASASTLLRWHLFLEVFPPGMGCPLSRTVIRSVWHASLTRTPGVPLAHWVSPTHARYCSLGHLSSRRSGHVFLLPLGLMPASGMTFKLSIISPVLPASISLMSGPCRILLSWTSFRSSPRAPVTYTYVLRTLFAMSRIFPWLPTLYLADYCTSFRCWKSEHCFWKTFLE